MITALRRAGILLVAPHATVVRGTCKHNGGPDILLLVRSPTRRGGQAWTPPRHVAPTWRVRLEATSVKGIWVCTRARTGATSAPRAARRAAPAQAPRCPDGARRLRRAPWGICMKR